MNIGSIVNIVENALNSAKTPANILPPLLLKCTALTRPGLSAYRIATEAIQYNKSLGIPTEENPDGSANMINQYTYNLIKCIVTAIKNDAVVHMVVPEQTLKIKATGVNGGGPMEVIGTNFMDSIGLGIMG